MRPKPVRGFTLIEVMMAMGLLALMMMILYGAFSLSHRAVEKAEARAEQSQALRVSSDLLASYIRSAYPYRVSPRDTSVFFSGEEHRLAFVSAFSSGMGGRGMARVSLSWEGADEGVLTLEEQVPVRLEDESGTGGYKNSLALRHGVRRLRIEYLDPQSQDEQWMGRWDGAERKSLPRAIRLNFTDATGEVRWTFPVMMRVLAQP